ALATTNSMDEGSPFLKDQYVESNLHPYEKSPSAIKPSDGPWSDHMGGSWRDAKFHAAVGLAELGDPKGVEWLIAGARRNDFGIDETVFYRAHVAAQTGSLRENCELALRDLFFGQDDDGQTEKTIDWDNCWAQIRNDFVPQPVRLASE
ncbi:MAG: hypothetical protein KDB22_29490, partial [Planctomycetales bacterium]|nr:hypothetical protein [Planctomycetales bacterium]